MALQSAPQTSAQVLHSERRRCELFLDQATILFHHRNQLTREVAEAFHISKNKLTPISGPSDVLHERRRPPSHPPSPTRSFLPWIQLPHLRSDESRRLAGTIFAANLRKTLPKAARNDSPARTALSPTAKDWNRLPADAVHHTNAAHLKAFIEKTIDML
ncbi:uncharacterized protein LOC144114182 isoform X2 [Amblyomma americanum]